MNLTDDQLVEVFRSTFLRSPNGKKVLEHLRQMYYDRDFFLEDNADRRNMMVGQHSVVRYILDTIEGDPQ